MKKLIVSTLLLVVLIFGFQTDLSANGLSDYDICVINYQSNGLSEDAKTKCSEYSSEDTKTNIRQGFSWYEPLLSPNEETAKIEREKNYYKYFFDAHLVPNAASVNDEFFKVDSFDNIGVLFFWILSIMLGMLNATATSLVSALIFFETNNIISNVIRIIIEIFNDTALGWENPEGFGYFLAMAIGLLYMIVNTIKGFRNRVEFVEIIKNIIVTMFLIALVPFSYTTIRPEIENLSSTLNNEVANRIDHSDNYEIMLKEKSFNALAYNGFLLKNYGTSSIEEIAGENGDLKKAEERVEKLLNPETTEEALEEEYNEYNNYFIGFTTGESVSQFFITIIFTIQAVLLGGIIAVPLILLEFVDILEVIIYGFIWVNVLILIKNSETSKISDFLIGRLQYLLYFTIINIIAIIFLMLTFQLTDIITAFSKISILYVLVFDVFLIIIYKLIILNKSVWWSVLKTILTSVPGIISGSISASELKTEFKDVIVKEAKFRSTKKEDEKDKKNEGEDKQSNSSKVNSNKESVATKSQIVDENHVPSSSKEIKLDSEENNSSIEEEGKTDSFGREDFKFKNESEPINNSSIEEEGRNDSFGREDFKFKNEGEPISNNSSIEEESRKSSFGREDIKFKNEGEPISNNSSIEEEIENQEETNDEFVFDLDD